MALTNPIGVIGDVHAEDLFLEAALGYFADRGIRAILCTGDVVDGKGSAQRCCQLLREHGVITVRGNHDRWLIEGTLRSLPDATRGEDLDPAEHAFLAGLPVQGEFMTPSGSLLLCHGMGKNDMARLGPDDFGYALDSNDELQTLLRAANHRWIVSGHTHRRMVRKIASLTVINAGTLKRDNDPCIAVIDFDRTEMTFFEFVGGALSTEPAAVFAL